MYKLNICLLPLLLLLSFLQRAGAQNVGIGTTIPLARLHVADSSVLFTGGAINRNAAPPVSGAGTRMMWFAPSAAFRAGIVTGTHWDLTNIGQASLGIGEDVNASGKGSVALGYQTLAAGDHSFAAGDRSHATAIGAFSQGSLAVASGSYSFALGASVRTTGEYATAIGAASYASGSFSFAAGAARANGEYSVAIGRSATATGDKSYALGEFSRSVGIYSYALGTGNTAKGYAETVLGANAIESNSSPDSWVGNDPILQVGNGRDSWSKSTAFTILKNGNTGIGSMLPQAKLHIEGNQLIKLNSSGGTPQLILEATQSGDGSRIQFRNSNTGNRVWNLYGQPHLSNDADARFHINYSRVGNVMEMRGNGNVWFRGTVTQNSDVNLKKNITVVDNALTKIQQLSGYNYYWKDSTRDQQLQAGLLAQEIETWMPELVTTDEAGIKSVNYSGLIPYLVEAIKEQQKIIEQLRKK